MGSYPFRFENAWLEHKHFTRDFEKWWKDAMVEGWEGYKWTMKLKIIKSWSKNWNKKVFGDLRLLEAALNNRLKELNSLEGSGNWRLEYMEEREKLKKEFHDILIKKEMSVRQKLKIHWAKEGMLILSCFIDF